MRNRANRWGRCGVSSSLLAVLGAGLLSGCLGGGGGGIGIDTAPGPSCNATEVFRSGEWVVQKQDSTIPEDPFEVFVNGQSCGTAKLLAFANRVDNTTRFPQVFTISAGGYLRLKAGADPQPPLPFGQSLVLGPAIFGTSFPSFPDTTLFFNPQLQRVSIGTFPIGPDTPPGTLVIEVIANDTNLPPQSTQTNQIMNLIWRIALHEPTDVQTQIDVDETFTFTENVTLDPGRTAEFQSFRLVQISSLFIDDARQDVDALRYRDAQGRLVELFYTPDQAGRLLPEEPTALDPSSTLDSLHTDVIGEPNGNTPSYRIRVTQTDGGLLAGPLVPRAFFVPTDNVNDDNLGAWIHQTPSQPILAGMGGMIKYSVTATSDPLPEP